MPLVLYSYQGKSINYISKNVEYIISKYVKMIKPEHPDLPQKLYLHMRRRTRCCRLYQSNIELELLSRILGHTSTHPVYMHLLGLRCSEIPNIMLSDIKWTNALIQIHDTKNNNVRQLPLSAELGKLLEEYILRYRPSVPDEKHLLLRKYVNQYSCMSRENV